MSEETTTITPVYSVANNKRRGEDWCFTVSDGTNVTVRRFPTEEEALNAREATSKEASR